MFFCKRINIQPTEAINGNGNAAYMPSGDIAKKNPMAAAAERLAALSGNQRPIAILSCAVAIVVTNIVI